MAQSQEIQKLIQGIGSGQMGRRDFLRRAAVLAACGGSATPTTAPAASAAPSAAAPSAATGGGATAVVSAAPASAASSVRPTVGGATPNSSTRTGITAAEWNPETIRANAGT